MLKWVIETYFLADQLSVNQLVAGSSPARGAIEYRLFPFQKEEHSRTENVQSTKVELLVVLLWSCKFITADAFAVCSFPFRLMTFLKIKTK